jgi:hypothetical protein
MWVGVELRGRRPVRDHVLRHPRPATELRQVPLGGVSAAVVAERVRPGSVGAAQEPRIEAEQLRGIALVRRRRLALAEAKLGVDATDAAMRCERIGRGHAGVFDAAGPNPAHK